MYKNSKVSGWFSIQQRTNGTRPQLAHLVHMKCNKIVLKQSNLEKSKHKSNCWGEATVNMSQSKLARFVESGVGLYTITAFSKYISEHLEQCGHFGTA